MCRTKVKGTKTRASCMRLSSRIRTTLTMKYVIRCATCMIVQRLCGYGDYRWTLNRLSLRLLLRSDLWILCWMLRLEMRHHRTLKTKWKLQLFIQLKQFSFVHLTQGFCVVFHLLSPTSLTTAQKSKTNEQNTLCQSKWWQLSGDG